MILHNKKRKKKRRIIILDEFLSIKEAKVLKAIIIKQAKEGHPTLTSHHSTAPKTAPTRKSPPPTQI